MRFIFSVPYETKSINLQKRSPKSFGAFGENANEGFGVIAHQLSGFVKNLFDTSFAGKPLMGRNNFTRKK
jgi:hypothetical protein